MTACRRCGGDRLPERLCGRCGPLSMRESLEENAGHLASLPSYCRPGHPLSSFSPGQLRIALRHLDERAERVRAEIARQEG